MQLLGVGRQASGGSIKVQTDCAEQGWGKALCLPSHLHGCSLPLCIVVDTGLVQGGGKKMERPGGDGEQVMQFLAFPPDSFTRSQLVLCRGMAKSKEHFSFRGEVWGLKCIIESAQWTESSLFPALGNDHSKTALKSLGHQAIVLTISPSFSSKLSLWVLTTAVKSCFCSEDWKWWWVWKGIWRNSVNFCLWLKKVKDFLSSLLHVILTSNQSAD